MPPELQPSCNTSAPFFLAQHPSHRYNHLCLSPLFPFPQVRPAELEAYARLKLRHMAMERGKDDLFRVGVVVTTCLLSLLDAHDFHSYMNVLHPAQRAS